MKFPEPFLSPEAMEQARAARLARLRSFPATIYLPRDLLGQSLAEVLQQFFQPVEDVGGSIIIRRPEDINAEDWQAIVQQVDQLD